MLLLPPVTFPGLFPHLRAKMEISSQDPSIKKPLMETRRVSTKMEAVRLLAVPALLQIRIPVTSISWS